MILQITITDDQLAALAELLAPHVQARIAPANTTPMNVKEAAKALGVSKANIYQRIKAKTIPTIPGYGRCLIPRSFITAQVEGSTE